MERPVEAVDIVSDGILVRFSDGTLSYFAHEFLRSSVGIGSNQLFVDGNATAGAGVFVNSREFLQVNRRSRVAQCASA